MAINKPTKIITHHYGGNYGSPLADTSRFTAQDVDVWHKERWPGFTSKLFRNNKGNFYHCGYHFIIERNGKTVQCRGMEEEAAAVIGQNTTSIMVCFAGNHDLNKPTVKQIQSWVRLYRRISKVHPQILPTDVFPHRAYAVKTCHGRNLSDTYFSERLNPTPNSDIVKELQIQVVQLLTQLYSLMRRKRFSNKET